MTSASLRVSFLVLAAMIFASTDSSARRLGWKSQQWIPCVPEPWVGESSLRAIGGRLVSDPEVFRWLHPLFCAEVVNEQDGTLCGMAIFADQGILAHTASVKVIEKSFQPYPWDGSATAARSVFNVTWDGRAQIDRPAVTSVPGYAEIYLVYKNGRFGSISYYIPELRGPSTWVDLDRRDPQHSVTVAPMWSNHTSMEDRAVFEFEDCELYTLGHQSRGDQGIRQPHRRLVAFAVQMENCERTFIPQNQFMGAHYIDTCTFGQSNRSRGTKGALCGIYSELGSPVLCKYRGSEHVVAQVTEKINSGTSSGGCTDKFKARIVVNETKWKQDTSRRFYMSPY